MEDPVEYELPGVPQVPVNDKVGLTFANALRALLRQDPDIMLVGEIRDHDTADIATHAALTGHLVLSTLHTNDAATALTRLVDLGIEPYLVASTVEAVLAQRLVRRICDACKRPTPLTSEERSASATAATDADAAAWKGQGCAAAAIPVTEAAPASMNCWSWTMRCASPCMRTRVPAGSARSQSTKACDCYARMVCD